MAGREVVVEPDLRAALSRRQIDDGDLGAAVLQKRLQPSQRAVDLALQSHVAIENDVNLTSIKRDALPVGQRRLAAMIVRAAPAPDAHQVEATEADGDGGVGLAGTLRDE